eukprot:4711991-Pyramimonas_sp.AAC.1
MHQCATSRRHCTCRRAAMKFIAARWTHLHRRSQTANGSSTRVGPPSKQRSALGRAPSGH